MGAAMDARTLRRFLEPSAQATQTGLLVPCRSFAISAMCSLTSCRTRVSFSSRLCGSSGRRATSLLSAIPTRAFTGKISSSWTLKGECGEPVAPPPPRPSLAPLTLPCLAPAGGKRHPLPLARSRRCFPSTRLCSSARTTAPRSPLWRARPKWSAPGCVRMWPVRQDPAKASAALTPPWLSSQVPGMSVEFSSQSSGPQLGSGVAVDALWTGNNAGPEPTLIVTEVRSAAPWHCARRPVSAAHRLNGSPACLSQSMALQAMHIVKEICRLVLLYHRTCCGIGTRQGRWRPLPSPHTARRPPAPTAHISLNDIAILLRTNSMTRPIEQVCLHGCAAAPCP